VLNPQSPMKGTTLNTLTPPTARPYPGGIANDLRASRYSHG
jgi:hypothetical protein